MDKPEYFIYVIQLNFEPYHQDPGVQAAMFFPVEKDISEN